MDENTDLAEVATLLPTAAAKYMMEMDNEAASVSALSEFRKMLVSLEQCGQSLNPIQFDIIATQVIISAVNAALFYIAYDTLSLAIEEMQSEMQS